MSSQFQELKEFLKEEMDQFKLKLNQIEQLNQNQSKKNEEIQTLVQELFKRYQKSPNRSLAFSKQKKQCFQGKKRRKSFRPESSQEKIKQFQQQQSSFQSTPLRSTRIHSLSSNRQPKSKERIIVKGNQNQQKVIAGASSQQKLRIQELSSIDEKDVQNKLQMDSSQKKISKKNSQEVIENSEIFNEMGNCSTPQKKKHLLSDSQQMKQKQKWSSIQNQPFQQENKSKSKQLPASIKKKIDFDEIEIQDNNFSIKIDEPVQHQHHPLLDNSQYSEIAKFLPLDIINRSHYYQIGLLTGHFDHILDGFSINVLESLKLLGDKWNSYLTAFIQKKLSALKKQIQSQQNIKKN